MNILNTENHSLLQVGCNVFEEAAYIYYGIIIGLNEFPALNIVDGKDYGIALDSQEIESIIIKYDEIMSTDRKYMKSSSFKNVFQPVLDRLKMLLKD